MDDIKQKYAKEILEKQQLLSVMKEKETVLQNEVNKKLSEWNELIKFEKDMQPEFEKFKEELRAESKNDILKLKKRFIDFATKN